MPVTTALRNVLPLLALCLGTSLLLTGCATKRDERLARLSRLAPEVLLDDGERALRSHDYGSAINHFEALMTRYSFKPEARQARLEVAYAYYKMDEKESARDAADTFIKDNPLHPSIDYAYYVRGLVDFERTPYKIELWLGGDPTGRPPQSARDSIDSLRTVVTKYPGSIYAADARRRMIFMRNRLADYELRVANYYMRRGAWVAAAQRARQAIEEFDGAPAVKDALRIMIACYRKLKYDDLADSSLQVFQRNFPGESPDIAIKQGLFTRLFNLGSPKTVSADTR